MEATLNCGRDSRLDPLGAGGSVRPGDHISLTLESSEPVHVYVLNEDRAAREGMTALYRKRLLDGLSTASAVRAASQRLLTSWRDHALSSHPFYWGAFVATGDWS